MPSRIGCRRPAVFDAGAVSLPTLISSAKSYLYLPSIATSAISAYIIMVYLQTRGSKGMRRFGEILLSL